MKVVAKMGLAGGGGARTLLLTVKFMDIGEKNQTNSLWVFGCSTDGKRQVIPLNPPAECKPGDRVVVKGYEHETAGGKVVENKRVAYS